MNGRNPHPPGDPAPDPPPPPKREQAATVDEMEPMIPQVDWETEKYIPADPQSTELAQLAWDTGLVYQVNCAVLHPQGLALGVSVTDDTPRRVYGLNLHRTSDPEGVWFDESLTSTGRRKLLRAGLLLRKPQRQSNVRDDLDTQDDDDVWRRQENVKRVLSEKGVLLHDSVIEAIVEAACDPKLRP